MRWIRLRVDRNISYSNRGEFPFRSMKHSCSGESLTSGAYYALKAMQLLEAGDFTFLREPLIGACS